MDHYAENKTEHFERKKDDAMKHYKKIFYLLFFFALSITVFGQNGNQPVQMADTMRSNGRIFVVVAVMLTILIGLILYIVRLDRKIGKLEKEIK
jgi:hypothetical protein